MAKKKLKIKCCYCKKKQAVGYFGISEPDIEPIPLCKECKIKLQIELWRKNG